MVSLSTSTKILGCGAKLKEQKCPFMVFLRYCKRWLIKIVKPIYLGSSCSTVNCSTIAMVNKDTSMCNIIKGTKTPILHLIGNCHFTWLINYETNTNVTSWICDTFYHHLHASIKYFHAVLS